MTSPQNDSRRARTSADKGRLRDRPAFRDRRLHRLAARLPGSLRAIIHWLRRPSAWWVRLPFGIFFLIGGSVLSPLPLFGLWMLPVGLVLIAEDLPFARHWVVRILDAVEKHWPHWFERRRR